MMVFPELSLFELMLMYVFPPPVLVLDSAAVDLEAGEPLVIFELEVKLPLSEYRVNGGLGVPL